MLYLLYIEQLRENLHVASWCQAYRALSTSEPPVVPLIHVTQGT